jgi:16S rRNA (cytosine1402-N4)-methyltransferase
LLNEVLAGLIQRPNGLYVDGTFGRGGHSRAILQRLAADGHLLAIDRDPQACASDSAKRLLQDKRLELVQGSFMGMTQWMQQRGWMGRVDGVLLDLGVSSPQRVIQLRGFSFMQDGPLDMRMDPSGGLSAADWLAAVEEHDLARVLKVYGEERYARRIARAIVSGRVEAPIRTTAQLAKLIEACVPRGKPGKHPATRSFQAIRIAVNGELDALESALEQIHDVLRPGGRLAVISFHSLEDRLVKRFFRDQSRGEVVPRHLPLPESAVGPRFKRVGSAIRPSDAEVTDNVRARSAVLRIGERLA